MLKFHCMYSLPLETAVPSVLTYIRMYVCISCIRNTCAYTYVRCICNPPCTPVPVSPVGSTRGGPHCRLLVNIISRSEEVRSEAENTEWDTPSLIVLYGLGCILYIRTYVVQSMRTCMHTCIFVLAMYTYMQKCIQVQL